MREQKLARDVVLAGKQFLEPSRSPARRHFHLIEVLQHPPVEVFNLPVRQFLQMLDFPLLLRAQPARKPLADQGHERPPSVLTPIESIV